MLVPLAIYPIKNLQRKKLIEVGWLKIYIMLRVCFCFSSKNNSLACQTEEIFRKKAEIDIILEKICQEWWQSYSALSNAAENSLENSAAVKYIRSFADISSPVYKKLFLSLVYLNYL